jgi:hypothetical protein
LPATHSVVAAVPGIGSVGTDAARATRTAATAGCGHDHALAALQDRRGTATTTTTGTEA